MIKKHRKHRVPGYYEKLGFPRKIGGRRYTLENVKTGKMVMLEPIGTKTGLPIRKMDLTNLKINIIPKYIKPPKVKKIKIEKAPSYLKPLSEAKIDYKLEIAKMNAKKQCITHVRGYHVAAQTKKCPTNRR